MLLVYILICIVAGELYLRIHRPWLVNMQWKDPSIVFSSTEYQKFEPTKLKGNKKRLLFLGDSYLGGSEVRSLSNRSPILLGNKLKDSVKIEIIATGGWGTDQVLLAFMQKGKARKPDIVVVAFNDNDLENILTYHLRGAGSRKPYFIMDEHDDLKLYDSYGHPLTYDFVIKNIKKPVRFQSHLFNLIWYCEKNIKVILMIWGMKSFQRLLTIFLDRSCPKNLILSEARPLQ